jgi:hypothetical protein
MQFNALPHSRGKAGLLHLEGIPADGQQRGDVAARGVSLDAAQRQITIPVENRDSSAWNGGSAFIGNGADNTAGDLLRRQRGPPTNK